MTWLHQKKEIFTDNPSAWQLFASDNIGKINRTDSRWQDLLNKLEEKKDWWEEKDYLQQIEGAYSNKSFAFISFGLNVQVKVPFATAQRMDERGEWNQTLSELVTFMKSC